MHSLVYQVKQSSFLPSFWCGSFGESEGNIIEFFSVFVIVYSIIPLGTDCEPLTVISMICLLVLIGLMVRVRGRRKGSQYHLYKEFVTDAAQRSWESWERETFWNMKVQVISCLTLYTAISRASSVSLFF